MKLKTSLRVVAAVTLFCFVTTQCVSAAPGAGLEIAAGRETPLSLNIDIPSDLGTVDSLYEAPAKTDPQFILHVQNAHANYEAQEKIKRLLAYMDRQYGFKTIFVEGASTKLNADYLRLFPDENRNIALCDRLAKDGELTGAEMYLMEADPKTEALGIEEAKLYRSNYDALKKVFGAESDINHFFQGFDAKLDRVASKTFTPEARELIADWKRFEQGRRAFMPFVKSLVQKAKKVLKVDIESLFAQVGWPQMTRLLVMQKMEKDLDKTRALAEKDALLKMLREKGASKELIATLQNFNEGTISVGKSRHEVSPREILEQLNYEMTPKGFKFSDYPAFSLYAGYVTLKAELDPKVLYAEIEYLFTQMLDALAKEPEQKSLLALYRDGELLRKLFSLELNRAEWKQVAAAKDRLSVGPIVTRLKEAVIASGDSSLRKDQQVMPQAFSSRMDELFAAGLDFYDLAHQREGVFYKEIESAMKERKITKAILITGGFHTDGMTDLFRENNVSYGIVTPRLSEKSDENLYRKIMLQKNTGTFEISYLEAILRLQDMIAQFAQGGGDVTPIMEKFMDVANVGRDRAMSLEEAIAELRKTAEDTGKTFLRGSGGQKFDIVEEGNDYKLVPVEEASVPVKTRLPGGIEVESGSIASLAQPVAPQAVPEAAPAAGRSEMRLGTKVALLAALLLTLGMLLTQPVRKSLYEGMQVEEERTQKSLEVGRQQNTDLQIRLLAQRHGLFEQHSDFWVDDNGMPKYGIFFFTKADLFKWIEDVRDGKTTVDRLDLSFSAYQLVIDLAYKLKCPIFTKAELDGFVNVLLSQGESRLQKVMEEKAKNWSDKILPTTTPHAVVKFRSEMRVGEGMKMLALSVSLGIIFALLGAFAFSNPIVVNFLITAFQLATKVSVLQKVMAGLGAIAGGALGAVIALWKRTKLENGEALKHVKDLAAPYGLLSEKKYSERFTDQDLRALLNQGFSEKDMASLFGVIQKIRANVEIMAPKMKTDSSEIKIPVDAMRAWAPDLSDLPSGNQTLDQGSLSDDQIASLGLLGHLLGTKLRVPETLPIKPDNLKSTSTPDASTGKRSEMREVGSLMEYLAKPSQNNEYTIPFETIDVEFVPQLSDVEFNVFVDRLRNEPALREAFNAKIREAAKLSPRKSLVEATDQPGAFKLSNQGTFSLSLLKTTAKSGAQVQIKFLNENSVRSILRVLEGLYAFMGAESSAVSFLIGYKSPGQQQIASVKSEVVKTGGAGNLKVTVTLLTEGLGADRTNGLILTRALRGASDKVTANQLMADLVAKAFDVKPLPTAIEAVSDESVREAQSAAAGLKSEKQLGAFLTSVQSSAKLLGFGIEEYRTGYPDQSGATRRSEVRDEDLVKALRDLQSSVVLSDMIGKNVKTRMKFQAAGRSFFLKVIQKDDRNGDPVIAAIALLNERGKELIRKESSFPGLNTLERINWYLLARDFAEQLEEDIAASANRAQLFDVLREAGERVANQFGVSVAGKELPGAEKLERGPEVARPQVQTADIVNALRDFHPTEKWGDDERNLWASFTVKGRNYLLKAIRNKQFAVETIVAMAARGKDELVRMNYNFPGMERMSWERMAGDAGDKLEQKSRVPSSQPRLTDILRALRHLTLDRAFVQPEGEGFESLRFKVWGGRFYSLKPIRGNDQGGEPVATAVALMDESGKELFRTNYDPPGIKKPDWSSLVAYFATQYEEESSFASLPGPELSPEDFVRSMKNRPGFDYTQKRLAPGKWAELLKLNVGGGQVLELGRYFSDAALTGQGSLILTISEPSKRKSSFYLAQGRLYKGAYLFPAGNTYGELPRDEESRISNHSDAITGFAYEEPLTLTVFAEENTLTAIAMKYKELEFVRPTPDGRQITIRFAPSARSEIREPRRSQMGPMEPIRKWFRDLSRNLGKSYERWTKPVLRSGEVSRRVRLRYEPAWYAPARKYLPYIVLGLMSAGGIWAVFPSIESALNESAARQEVLYQEEVSENQHLARRLEISASIDPTIFKRFRALSKEWVRELNEHGIPTAYENDDERERDFVALLNSAVMNNEGLSAEFVEKLWGLAAELQYYKDQNKAQTPASSTPSKKTRSEVRAVGLVFGLVSALAVSGFMIAHAGLAEVSSLRTQLGLGGQLETRGAGVLFDSEDPRIQDKLAALSSAITAAGEREVVVQWSDNGIVKNVTGTFMGRIQGGQITLVDSQVTVYQFPADSVLNVALAPSTSRSEMRMTGIDIEKTGNELTRVFTKWGMDAAAVPDQDKSLATISEVLRNAFLENGYVYRGILNVEAGDVDPLTIDPENPRIQPGDVLIVKIPNSSKRMVLVTVDVVKNRGGGFLSWEISRDAKLINSKYRRAKLSDFIVKDVFRKLKTGRENLVGDPLGIAEIYYGIDFLASDVVERTKKIDELFDLVNKGLTEVTNDVAKRLPPVTQALEPVSKIKVNLERNIEENLKRRKAGEEEVPLDEKLWGAFLTQGLPNALPVFFELNNNQENLDIFEEIKDVFEGVAPDRAEKLWEFVAIIHRSLFDEMGILLEGMKTATKYSLDIHNLNKEKKRGEKAVLPEASNLKTFLQKMMDFIFKFNRTDLRTELARELADIGKIVGVRGVQEYLDATQTKGDDLKLVPALKFVMEYEKVHSRSEARAKVSQEKIQEAVDEANMQWNSVRNILPKGLESLKTKHFEVGPADHVIRDIEGAKSKLAQALQGSTGSSAVYVVGALDAIIGSLNRSEVRASIQKPRAAGKERKTALNAPKVLRLIGSAQTMLEGSDAGLSVDKWLRPAASVIVHAHDLSAVWGYINKALELLKNSKWAQDGKVASARDNLWAVLFEIDPVHAAILRMGDLQSQLPEGDFKALGQLPNYYTDGGKPLSDFGEKVVSFGPERKFDVSLDASGEKVTAAADLAGNIRALRLTINRKVTQDNRPVVAPIMNKMQTLEEQLGDLARSEVRTPEDEVRSYIASALKDLQKVVYLKYLQEVTELKSGPLASAQQAAERGDWDGVTKYAKQASDDLLRMAYDMQASVNTRGAAVLVRRDLVQAQRVIARMKLPAERRAGGAERATLLDDAAVAEILMRLDNAEQHLKDASLEPYKQIQLDPAVWAARDANWGRLVVFAEWAIGQLQYLAPNIEEVRFAQEELRDVISLIDPNRSSQQLSMASAIKSVNAVLGSLPIDKLKPKPGVALDEYDLTEIKETDVMGAGDDIQDVVESLRLLAAKLDGLVAKGYLPQNLPSVATALRAIAVDLASSVTLLSEVKEPPSEEVLGRLIAEERKQAFGVRERFEGIKQFEEFMKKVNSLSALTGKNIPIRVQLKDGRVLNMILSHGSFHYPDRESILLELVGMDGSQDRYLREKVADIVSIESVARSEVRGAVERAISDAHTILDKLPPGVKPLVDAIILPGDAQNVVEQIRARASQLEARLGNNTSSPLWDTVQRLNDVADRLSSSVRSEMRKAGQEPDAAEVVSARQALAVEVAKILKPEVLTKLQSSGFEVGNGSLVDLVGLIVLPANLGNITAVQVADILAKLVTPKAGELDWQKFLVAAKKFLTDPITAVSDVAGGTVIALNEAPTAEELDAQVLQLGMNTGQVIRYVIAKAAVNADGQKALTKRIEAIQKGFDLKGEPIGERIQLVFADKIVVGAQNSALALASHEAFEGGKNLTVLIPEGMKLEQAVGTVIESRGVVAALAPARNLVAMKAAQLGVALNNMDAMMLLNQQIADVLQMIQQHFWIDGTKLAALNTMLSEMMATTKATAVAA